MDSFSPPSPSHVCTPRGSVAAVGQIVQVRAATLVPGDPSEAHRRLRPLNARVADNLVRATRQVRDRSAESDTHAPDV